MKIKKETLQTIILDKEDLEIVEETIQAYKDMSDADKKQDCGWRVIELNDEKSKPLNLRLEFKYMVEGE